MEELENMQLIEKIKEEIAKRKLSVLKFSNETAIPAYRIYKWFDGKGSPKHADIQILEEWLRKNANTESSKEVEKKEETPISFLEERRNKKLAEVPYLVPFMNVKAQAGYTKVEDQAMFVDALEKYALPPGVNPQGANWRYWEIEGNSMEPEFHSGDVILTSQVHPMDWDNLRNFYVYVIVTAEKVLLKRLYCKAPLEWVLISANEDEYPQQLLPVEFVKEVWVYRRSIVNKAPVAKMYEIKV